MDKMNKSENVFKGLKITYIKGKPLPNRHVEFRKSQYEEIKNNRNIISYTIPNDISDKEEEAAHEWWINHECFRSKEFWDHDMESWSPYPHIHLGRSSLGTKIDIVCPVCREQENVTDYDLW